MKDYKEEGKIYLRRKHKKAIDCLSNQHNILLGNELRNQGTDMQTNHLIQ
jgi:hypothetical protein